MQTRKPTGRVAFPIILLAGVEGSGKTWAAAEATGIDFIDRAFFLEIGEQSADAYANVPGADYEIIEHNGTFSQILTAAREAGQIKADDGKANMLIVDSMTNLWELLSAMAQDRANQRQARRGRRRNDQEAQITMDLWNWAKANFCDFVQALRDFPGIVIVTARLDNIVSVENGKPSGERMWKVRVQKDFPYDVQAEVQVRRPREFTLTKSQNTFLQLQPGGEMPLDDFSIAKLLDAMNVHADAAQSSHVAVQPGAMTADEAYIAFTEEVLSNPEQVAKRLVSAGDVQNLRTMWKIGQQNRRDDVRIIAQAAAESCAKVSEASEPMQQAIGAVMDQLDAEMTNDPNEVAA